MFDWRIPPALLNILVASEDERSITALARLLIREGHIVHSVYDHGLVAECVERYRPDVCIIYLDTPQRDSFAIAQALRRLPPSRRPFLIAVSGSSAGVNDALLAHNAGFDHSVTNAADHTSLVQFIGGIGTRRRIKKR